MPTGTMLVQSALVLTCVIALTGGAAVDFTNFFCVYSYYGNCYEGVACPDGTIDLAPDANDNAVICTTGHRCCKGTPSTCYAALGSNCVHGICEAAATACTCEDGYTGPLCEADVCTPNPCENNGQCASNALGITCTCADAGTYGTNCEINACAAPADNQCSSTGTSACVPVLPTDLNKDDPYTCTCKDGYYNTFCQSNYCDEEICGPNADSCVGASSAPNYVCTCKTGFSGQNCDVDVCDGKCNGQTCIRAVGSYTCDCAAGFEGTECETQVTYTCGGSTPGARFLGGTAATAGHAKSTVRVTLAGNTVGSGVFLHHSAEEYKSAYLVFTTAEVCAICQTNALACEVVLGDNDLTSTEDEQTITVSNIVYQVDFSKQDSLSSYFQMDPENLKRNGLCVLQLAGKIIESASVGPVCGYSDEEYTDCYVAGYGISNEAVIPSTTKTILPVELVKSDCVCAKLRGKTVADMAVSIRCAVACDLPETKGTCVHDYGGPVYCKGITSNRYSLKGWVTMEAPFKQPATCDKGTILWTDAADFATFIQSSFDDIVP